MPREFAVSFRGGGDACPLAGILGVPDGTGPFPAVVVLHGNGGWKEEEHLVGLAEELVESGIVALRFDATGIGESGGEFPERFRIGTYRGDIDAALDYLAEAPDVDETKLGVAGHSLGGMLAVIAAAEDSRIRACCAISPPSLINESANARALMPTWRAQGYREIANPHHGALRLPVDFYDDADQWNAITSAPDVMCPLLVLAGEADETVLAADSRRIHTAAPVATSGWWLLPEIDHFYKRQPQQVVHVSRHIADFFGVQLT